MSRFSPPRQARTDSGYWSFSVSMRCARAVREPAFAGRACGHKLWSEISKWPMARNPGEWYQVSPIQLAESLSTHHESCGRYSHLAATTIPCSRA